MRVQRFLVPFLAAMGMAGPTASAQDGTANVCFARHYACSQVTVPLDRTGNLKRNEDLAVVRRLVGREQTRTAVLALAGGPGQAAVPLAGVFAEALAPLLTTRDLIVLDQRGVGESGEITCQLGRGDPTVAQTRACAAQLGPARGLYRTVDSIQDIEDVRAAFGYDRLLLYGVSYGTRVALDYASAFPDRVEGLVLDSVVSQADDPLDLTMLGAIRPMLADLCRSACPFARGGAWRELVALGARLRRAPLRARVRTVAGRLAPRTLTEQGLLELLADGDFDPWLRIALPGAVHAALGGDAAPLLRLPANAALLGAIEDILRASGSPAVPLATTCEEHALPWPRTTDTVAGRRAALAAAVLRLPAAATAPFGRETAGLVARLCLGWPTASVAPVAPGPLPAVPTLVLEGAGDLRTPVGAARAAVAAIPAASVVVVPRTGHSVLGADTTGCAKAALQAFADGTPVAPCTALPHGGVPLPSPTTPLARLAPAGGAGGRAGRTAAAVRLTMLDAVRAGFNGLGGLRGGTQSYDFEDEVVHLKRFSYVAGVEVTGTYTGDARPTHIVVGGRAAAHGRLRISGSGRVTGRLDGHPVAFELALAKAPASRRR